MKTEIYYYSGAGNTAFIAREMAKALEDKSHHVELQRITEAAARGVGDDFDMLGIGFPIYFRRAPELVYDLLARIRGKNRPVFFFCTKGLYSGNATQDIMSFSIGRNCRPVGFMEFYMPGTDFLILFARKGSLSEKLLKFIHSRNIAAKIEKFARRVHNAQSAAIPPKKWYTSLDDLIVKRLETLYDNQHKDYIPQFHSKPEICIKCMKCVKGCPRNNIFFDGRIRFGARCDTCFHCINHCPAESIQIGTITERNVRYNKAQCCKSRRTSESRRQG